METSSFPCLRLVHLVGLVFFQDSWKHNKSPLAGETNWMETPTNLKWWSYLPHRPHSLGKLIEWKQRNHLFILRLTVKSPLAGETNWMETQMYVYFSSSASSCPHSLGKLIEWNPPVLALWSQFLLGTQWLHPTVSSRYHFCTSCLLSHPWQAMSSPYLNILIGFKTVWLQHSHVNQLMVNGLL